MAVASCTQAPSPPPPVAIIITDKGENQKAPKTDEDWAKVRAGAATLVESANLLMLLGRARDGVKWHAAAKRMSDAAQIALAAAEKKDVTALFVHVEARDLVGATRVAGERGLADYRRAHARLEEHVKKPL